MRWVAAITSAFTNNSFSLFMRIRTLVRHFYGGNVRVFWRALVIVVCAVFLEIHSVAQLSVTELVKRSSDAVVLIVISNSAGEETALGSGFIVSADGEIATNYHVMKGANSAIVKLPNGSFFPVSRVLASDEQQDLAIIKVNGKNLPFLSLGDVKRLHVGDRVVAIGSPLGLEGTVSDGIISALREVKGRKWIQTTAPVSHGNSGGPLLDMTSHVVGVITWGINLDQGQNLNFAAPSDDLVALLDTAHHKRGSVASAPGAPNQIEAAQGKESGNEDSLPMFKRHRLGESAEQFFSIATTSNGTLTVDLCATILRERNPVPATQSEACGAMTEALLGINAKLLGNFANESGAATVTFVKGRLARMTFRLDEPIEVVVADMSSKLGAGPIATETAPNTGGRMAAWRAKGVFAIAGELKYPGQTSQESMVKIDVLSLEAGLRELDSASSTNPLD
jgi:S1-C subfamily serine protease